MSIEAPMQWLKNKQRAYHKAMKLHLEKLETENEKLREENKNLMHRVSYLAERDLKLIRIELKNQALGREMTDDEFIRYEQSLKILKEAV